MSNPTMSEQRFRVVRDNRICHKCQIAFTIEDHDIECTSNRTKYFHKKCWDGLYL